MQEPEKKKRKFPLVAVLVSIAAVVMIVAAVFNFDGGREDMPVPVPEQEVAVTPAAELTPPPTPNNPVSVQNATSVAISWLFQVGNINEVTLRIGDILDVWADVLPVDADVEVQWETTNPTVVSVTVNAENQREVELEARSAGQATITATVGEHTAAVVVQVR